MPMACCSGPYLHCMPGLIWSLPPLNAEFNLVMHELYRTESVKIRPTVYPHTYSEVLEEHADSGGAAVID